MKKIIFFPIISFVLCSCALTPNKSDSSKTDTENPSSTSSDPFHDGPINPQVVEEGLEHVLPWNVNYELFKNEGGALDYASYHQTYDFEGTKAYAYGMRAVTDISINVNGSLIPYSNFKIIHFCKVNHDKWPDGGQIQISKMKPTKLVLELVSQKKYTYSSSSAPTIYAGERKISAPSTAVKTVSPIHEEFNVFTVTYQINSTSAEMIKIKNDQTFSMYIQSMQFE